jgi:hypothetical protein
MPRIRKYVKDLENCRRPAVFLTFGARKPHSKNMTHVLLHYLEPFEEWLEGIPSMEGVNYMNK